MKTFAIRSLLSRGATTTLVSLVLGGVLGCNDVMMDTRTSRNAGIKQYNEGQYAEASGTFRTIIRHNPADYGSHYFLGASLARIGSYEQAIQQYKTTLVLMNGDLVGREDRPFRLQVLTSLAEAAVASKDPNPQNVTVQGAPPAENQYLLAKIDRESGDADAALEAYAQASLLAPKDFDIAKEYGLYLLQLGLKDRARTELRRAYRLNANDQQVTLALRRVGVVPGPSLKTEDELARPIIPLGPIPPLELAAPAAQRTASTPTE